MSRKKKAPGQPTGLPLRLMVGATLAVALVCGRPGLRPPWQHASNIPRPIPSISLSPWQHAFPLYHGRGDPRGRPGFLSLFLTSP